MTVELPGPRLGARPSARNGRLDLFSSLLSTLQGGPKVTENRYVYQVLASGTCLTLCTHRQYTYGGGGDRKPRTKSF